MFKRLFSLLIVLFLSFSFCTTINAENINTYTDSVTGISFDIPQGWKLSPLNEEREYIKIKFLPENNDGASILFGYTDMWEKLSDDEKIGHSRSDINLSAIIDGFTNREILQMIGYDNLDAEIGTTYYNGVKYLEIFFNQNYNILDVSIDTSMITLIYIDDGYWYQFVYSDMIEQTHYQEFKKMMSSVKYKASNNNSYDNAITSIDSEGNLHFNFLNLILNLIITIVVYSLPIIIYRYGIKKQPLTEKKAKKITLIYAIIGFFIMAILLGGAPGGAIILWSFVNYKILTTSTKNDIPPKHEKSIEEIPSTIISNKVYKDDIEINQNKVDNNEIYINIFEAKETLKENITNNTTTEKTILIKKQPIIPKETIEVKKYTKVLYCRKCGTKLLEDSDFCHKCGLRIIKEETK